MKHLNRNGPYPSELDLRGNSADQADYPCCPLPLNNVKVIFFPSLFLTPFRISKTCWLSRGGARGGRCEGEKNKEKAEWMDIDGERGCLITVWLHSPWCIVPELLFPRRDPINAAKWKGVNVSLKEIYAYTHTHCSHTQQWSQRD